jgi:hypothetical protein
MMINHGPKVILGIRASISASVQRPFLKGICMRIFVTMSMALAALSACGGGDSADDGSVSVYKYNGTVQCASGGLTLAQMQGQLSAASVQVRASACGTDGTVQPEVCGAPDSRIGIFQIPAAQVSAAAAAGFAPLRSKPGAKTVSCA